MTTERSLGDPAEHVGSERDVSLDEWVDGVRGFRVPVDLVTVHDPDGSGSARLDEIASVIDGLPDGPKVDALIEEAEGIQARVLCRRRFVLEQRSAERIEATRQNAMESVGVEQGGDWSPSQVLDVTLMLILDQVVEPEGVTLEQLRRVHAAAPDQVDLLADGLKRANAGAAGSRSVVRDFSARRRSVPRTAAS